MELLASTAEIHQKLTTTTSTTTYTINVVCPPRQAGSKGVAVQTSEGDFFFAAQKTAMLFRIKCPTFGNLVVYKVRPTPFVPLHGYVAHQVTAADRTTVQPAHRH